MALWVLAILILTLSNGRIYVAGTDDHQTPPECSFPAIFNFGDSYSDTGAASAAFDAFPSPNGMSFFGEPSGRVCDGRLIIDFIAERLGHRYLSAYLDSIGADFTSGANFAVGGASIRPGGFTPFNLGVQISQFQQFKSRSINRFRKQQANNLPKPDDFSKALYTFDIGHSDLTYNFQHEFQDLGNASIPKILDQFSTAIQVLYEEGARSFWIHNTGPTGCLPFNTMDLPPEFAGDLDVAGCVNALNKVAQEFNRQLKVRLIRLETHLPHSVFTYVDMYSAKYALISDAKHQGFVDPQEICCGSSQGHEVDCGKKITINGTVYGDSCSNPSSHISWDGIHYTQAANHWVFKYITRSSSLEQACHKPNSGSRSSL